MTVVNDNIAAQLIELQKLVAAPTGALNFGRDLFCVTDLEPDLREIGPDTPLGITVALARRLGTPRGGLIAEPDYGLDVRGMLNRGTPQRDLRMLAGQIRTECRKDDRVQDIAVNVAFAGNTLSVSCILTPADPLLVAFKFVLAVTSADVIVETIT